MKNIFKQFLKSISSRFVYLFIGLSFALVIIVAQAAISSSSVTGGTTLTASRWNTMINDLVTLDTRLSNVEGGSNVQVYSCPNDSPSFCASGAWIYTTCAGQITTLNQCHTVVWTGSPPTICNYNCTPLGNLRIY